MQPNLPKLKSRTSNLIRKHLLGQLSKAETAELEQWIEADPTNKQLFLKTSALYATDLKTNKYAVQKPDFPFRKVAIFSLIAIIAIILLIVAISVRTQKNSQSNLLAITRNKDTANDSLLSSSIITPYDTTREITLTDTHKLYQFKNDSVKTVMEKLHDWYHINYIYSDTIRNRFTGSVATGVSLDETLRLLAKMGHVYFKRDLPGSVVIAANSAQFR